MEMNAFQSAILPFAIVEEFDLPCAYERSIKITPHGLLANRYLISIDADLLDLDRVQAICERLQMPTAAWRSLAHRYSRASQFMMGFEERLPNSITKIYLETRGAGRPAVLSHVGWKWSSNTHSTFHTTLYRRIEPRQCLDLLTSLSNSGAAVSLPWLNHVLSQSHVHSAPLVCLFVLENGRCRGLDVNLYSMNCVVESLAEHLEQIVSEFGLSSTEFDHLMSLSGPMQLGHISAGPGYVTIYYQSRSAVLPQTL